MRACPPTIVGSRLGALECGDRSRRFPPSLPKRRLRSPHSKAPNPSRETAVRSAVMKRTIVILALAVTLVAACQKRDEPVPAAPPPETASSAPAPTTPAAPDRTNTVPDVTAANAPVPAQGLELWLRGDYGVTADAAGKVTSWAVEGSPLKAGVGDPAESPSLAASAINGKPAVRFDGDK